MLKGTITEILLGNDGGTIEQDSNGSSIAFETAPPDGAAVGTRVYYEINTGFFPVIAENLSIINSASELLEISEDDLIQSPYTYLQAAGSTGADGSTEGIHLRWEFFRSLDRHLPKGNLAASGATYEALHGFNKPDDFVKIFRVPYTVKHQAIVNLGQNPDSIDETGSERIWIYDVQVNSVVFPVINTSVFLRFKNTVQYDSIKYNLLIDPATQPADFLRAYTGHIEAGAVDKLSFAATLFMQLKNPGSGAQGITRAETISVENDAGLPDESGNPIQEKLAVSCRHQFTDNDFISGTGDVIPIVENTAILQPDDTVEHKLLAENIKYIRFDYQDNFPAEIRFETYEDFITGANNHPDVRWEQIDDFAISDDDNVVFPRLDNSDINVDGNWPRFYVNSNNPPNPSAIPMKVRTDNYKDKWEKTAPTPYVSPSPEGQRIKEGVVKYLQLSMSILNPLAEEIVPVDPDPDPNNTYSVYDDNVPGESQDNAAQINISYLNLLKLASVDYHIARMLGLGHIDHETTSPVKFGNQKFIYLKYYRTAAALENNQTAKNVTHFYMTLPTGKTNQRLPQSPNVPPVQYGLYAPSLPHPILITDPNGYMPFERVRYIRLFVQEPQELAFPDDLPDFFVPPALFCLEENTRPVFFGVEYKHQSESTFRSPELNIDENYTDANAVFEVLPLMADFQEANKPIFIHDEREEGIHNYAMYAVNWFSRPSPLSVVQSTNATQFPHYCTLLPPSNFAVQLIQKEQPLLFTSQTEQQRLANLNTGNSNDNEILVRATFDWNEAHHLAYTKVDDTDNITQAADEIEFFFRNDLPVTIKGRISAINPSSPSLNDNTTVEVTVGSYTIIYNNQTITVSPSIPAGQESKYVGSFLNVDGTKYEILSISNSGTLKFTLRKNTVATLTEIPVNSNNFTSVQTYHSPSVDDKFSISENDTKASNWPNGKLVKKIPIVNFLTNFKDDGTPSTPAIFHTEKRTEPDGSETKLNLGGIFEKATIKEYLDVDDMHREPDPDLQLTAPNIGIPNSKTGVFKITFNSFQLANHPDSPEVEWYKGSARIKISGTNPSGEKKTLNVIDIDQSQSTLVIRAYDPAFNVNSAYAPVGDYIPIQTGTNVLVNFHPSYRVYLTEEAGKFDQTTVLPSFGQEIRKSIMSVRSSDIDISGGCFSPLAPPALLQAVAINPPEQPGMPLGPLFVTRPDFNGKSTYTFDVEIVTNSGTRKPHALIFYRASEQMVLDALYSKTTIQQIRNDLAALPHDEAIFAFQRFNDLVNVELDGNLFKKYHTFPSQATYRLPNPDNPDNGFNGAAPGTIISQVKEAINNAFLPLTEQPVIYQHINYGFQPTNKKPVIKDKETGRFLDPGNTNFDPFPMAVRYEKNSSGTILTTGNGANDNSYFVRFTDFTLDGTSINVYFFYAKEMMLNFVTGERSPIAGPISLVNSYPAKPVEIKKVVTQLANPIDEILTAVKFEINPYVENERIKRFQIYRATKPEDMRSIRTMKLAKTVELADAETDLLDDFSDVDFPLYGDPLFYRIVALREILNEQNLPENIPSFPSDAVLASVVDVFNPLAPDIDYISDELTTVSPVQLPNVVLKWNKTAHNATYFVYKMNNSGNWVLQTQIKSNDSKIFYPVGNLLKEDDDGNEIFHRYKVDIENSSGLLNLEEKSLVI